MLTNAKESFQQNSLLLQGNQNSQKQKLLESLVTFFFLTYKEFLRQNVLGPSL